MARIDDLLSRYRLLQIRRYQAAVEARKETQKPTIRIGDRDPLTGQYQVIHPNGSVTTNGVKIFNASYPAGQVVRATQAIGQPTIALDWKNVAKKEEVVRVEEEQILQRILAIGSYQWMQNDYYSLADNRTFALNTWQWLAQKGKRIGAFTTASIVTDYSLDDPVFSEVRADLTNLGFSFVYRDFFNVSGFELLLSECDIFYLPGMDFFEFSTPFAEKLAAFAKQKKGVMLATYGDGGEYIYTGLRDVFGIARIINFPAPFNEILPVTPAPKLASPLLKNVNSIYIQSGKFMVPVNITPPSTYTKVFATEPPVFSPAQDQARTLAYLIQLG